MYSAVGNAASHEQGTETWFQRFRRGWDVPAAVSMFMLLACGIIFIGCIGGGREGFPNESALRQIVWGGIGICVWFFCAMTDYRKWKPVGAAVYIVSILLLVIVLGWGTKIYGARRWLIIDLGFMQQQMQPSELAKIALILFLSFFMTRAGYSPKSWRSFMAVVLYTLLPFALVVIEPDLGGALMFVPIASVMIFVRGLSWSKILIVFAAVAVLVGAFAVNEIFRLHPLLKEYHRDRIRTFLDPEADPLGRGYNATQARIAVGSGGLWGKGIGDGDMSGLGFIPRTVANNDFIFAVIAEETGFAGAFCLIVLFGVLILSCFAIAWRAPDIFGRVLASGFGTMLFCHVFVNIGMNINLAPVTGIPLPLVSYGGTFLVTTMAMLGILQSISRTGALLISGR